MSKVRYLLDENVNRAIQRQLRRLDPNIEVIAVGEPGAPPAGSPDPEILEWIEKHGYILVTENRSTMPVHLKEYWAKGGHVPGVFFLRPFASLSAVIEMVFFWSSRLTPLLRFAVDSTPTNHSPVAIRYSPSFW